VAAKPPSTPLAAGPRALPALALALATLISACPAGVAGQPQHPHSAYPKTLPNIPERFRGEWNQTLAACGTGDNDSAVTIGAHSVQFYESQGPVVRVTLVSENEVSAAVRLRGEGETWQTIYHYRLSPDGEDLIDLGEGGPVTRHRCPARPGR